MAMIVPFGRMATAILKYPSGRYGIVGSVPGELTEDRGRGRVSKVWNTEQEVVDALLSIGCTKFQLSDCTWFEAKQGTADELERMARQINGMAPPVADVPFSLTAPVSKAKQKQETLF